VFIMRVVGVDEFGGPEVLKMFDVPEPHAGPGELRIRVRAATVNPTDTYTRNGARAEQLKNFPLPYVPGMDVAGEVDEVGRDAVTGLQVGDAAMAIVVPSGGYGGYSQFIVVPAESAVRIPSGVSVVQASTLPMNGLTAQLSLDQLALSAGQTLAVTGAAGAYGGYVVQLAKAAGLRVIADASTADEALVRSLGADIVVRRGVDVAARIRDVVPEGVDALADGSVQNELLFPAVKDGGGFVSVRGFTVDAPRGIVTHQTWVRDYARENAKLDNLRALVEQGAVTLRVAATFAAAHASEAHRILQAGGTRGRLVLEF
jgi:NADPH:quinone reductase